MAKAASWALLSSLENQLHIQAFGLWCQLSRSRHHLAIESGLYFPSIYVWTLPAGWREAWVFLAVFTAWAVLFWVRHSNYRGNEAGSCPSSALVPQVSAGKLCYLWNMFAGVKPSCLYEIICSSNVLCVLSLQRQFWTIVLSLEENGGLRGLPEAPIRQWQVAL